MDVSTLQIWLLVGISATLFGAFVIVTILILLDLVNIVTLPASVSGPLRGTLILQFSVIAVGAIAALLAPNLIQQKLNQVARDVGTVSAPDTPTIASIADPTPALAATTIACATPELSPLLYIQFGSEDKRGVAEAVQAAAKAQGWFAPGIELTENYTRAETQIRYFRTDEREDAETVAARLLESNGLPADTRVVEARADVRACQFEIWIGSGSS